MAAILAMSVALRPSLAASRDLIRVPLARRPRSARSRRRLSLDDAFLDDLKKLDLITNVWIS